MGDYSRKLWEGRVSRWPEKLTELEVNVDVQSFALQSDPGIHHLFVSLGLRFLPPVEMTKG